MFRNFIKNLSKKKLILKHKIKNMKFHGWYDKKEFTEGSYVGETM